MTDLQQIRQAIAALEAQRAALGDAVVDASLAALHKQLADIEAAQSREQRKLVSILFADLAGFTSMADRLDPEDVRAVQQAYFKAVTASIREQGGIIEKYIGDAIMAVFGLPRAEESDPDRAVRAGLGMQAALTELNGRLEREVGLRLERPLQMRVGVNTGLAIVSMISADNFAVVGDSVNLASRLQTAAPTHGVLISHDTYRHVRGVFDLQALEPISVKGKPEPIQVYLVTGTRKRAFRNRDRGIEGVETRMVGRDAEQQALQQAFLIAAEDRECTAITVVADPGMGKSRLMYEFENWIDLQSQQVSVIRGRARMETQRLPYALLRDLVALQFRIQDDDPLPAVWRKFEVGFAELFAGRLDLMSFSLAGNQAEILQMQAHFLGQLLGYDFSSSPHIQAVKDDPAQIRERAANYLESYLNGLAAARPLIILLEDLHWSDDASLDLINRLAGHWADMPVMILATARPAFYERRAHWMEGQDFHQRIDLRPLSKRDSRRLVEEVLKKVPEIPESLRELVVSNAEGNPFYVEELIKMLIEEGVIIKDEQQWHVIPERLTKIQIPPTLTGVLQARLEGLSLVERTLMQQASVVGRVFWDRALAYLNRAEAGHSGAQEIESALAELRQKEMVYHRENSIFADAQELSFKHNMLREAAYGSVLKRMRRIYHRLTAEWLVEITQAGGRVDEYTALIAEHYWLADLPIDAADWFIRAGEHAQQQGALPEAGGFYDRALELLPATEGDRRWSAALGRNTILILLGEDGAFKASLDGLAELARALNNDAYLAEAHVRRALYLAGHGEDRHALHEYQAALLAARRASHLQIEARVLASMSISHVRLGERGPARSSAEAAVEVALKTGQKDILGKVYTNAAVTFLELGELATAIPYLNLAVDWFKKAGDLPGMGNSLSNLGYQYVLLGMMDEAQAALERSIEISRRIGHRRQTAFSGLNLGLARVRAHDPSAALPLLQESIAELRLLGDDFGQAAGLTYQGLAHEAAGDVEQAAACFKQAMDMQERAGITAYCMDARAGLARCLLAGGRLAEALEQAALLWEYLEQHAAAGMEFPIRAYLTCALVARAAAREEESNRALTAGHQQLLERVGKISDPAFRRSYLENVPENREILGLWEASRPPA